MFLVGALYLAVHFLFHFHISYAILDEEQQAFWATHGCKYTVCRCVHIKVGLVFGRVVNYLTVEIRQYALLIVLLDVFVRIFFYEWRNGKVGWILLTEAVEWCTFSCSRTIESTLNWHNTSHRVIFHVIGEYH